MKILLVGLFRDKNAVGGDGYSNAAEGILYVCEKMVKEKILESVITVNSFEQIPQNEKFDYAFLFVNPMTVLANNRMEIYKFFLRNVNHVIFNIVWETVPLPSIWESLIKDPFFYGISTPSKFYVDEIFKQYQKQNIFYLPHFINTANFSLVNIKDKEKEDTFTCLFVGQYTKRKGVEESLIGFSRTAGNFLDTELILKCNSMSPNEIPLMTVIKNTVIFNCPQWKSSVYIIDKNLSFKEMGNLYRSASLFLFPSRSEGFGLPIPEASSCGIPVIYTDWGPMSETGSFPGNIPIEYHLDEAYSMSHFGYENGSKYAIPNIDNLMKSLYNKYVLWKEDRKEYYQMCQGNNKLVEQKYGYEPVKNCLLEIMKG